MIKEDAGSAGGIAVEDIGEPEEPAEPRPVDDAQLRPAVLSVGFGVPEAAGEPSRIVIMAEPEQGEGLGEVEAAILEGEMDV